MVEKGAEAGLDGILGFDFQDWIIKEKNVVLNSDAFNLYKKILQDA